MSPTELLKLGRTSGTFVYDEMQRGTCSVHGVFATARRVCRNTHTHRYDYIYIYIYVCIYIYICTYLFIYL